MHQAGSGAVEQATALRDVELAMHDQAAICSLLRGGILRQGLAATMRYWSEQRLCDEEAEGSLTFPLDPACTPTTDLRVWHRFTGCSGAASDQHACRHGQVCHMLRIGIAHAWCSETLGFGGLSIQAFGLLLLGIASN